jgi:protein-disulfide isomerase
MAMPKAVKSRKKVEEDVVVEEQVVENVREKSLADKMMPFMMVVLLVMTFGLGYMFNKLQGGGNSGTVKGKYKNFEEAMKDMGKKAGVKDTKKLVACMNSGEKQAMVDADLAEGSGVGVAGTPAFFINGRLIPGAVPFEEFKKVIDQELGTVAMDASVERKTVSVGNASTKGDANAAVKMIEYSDFQCPFCSRAFPTVEQVLKEYSGKVQLAYKHYPLKSIHPRAQKAAEVVECAKDQGKFWEMHDALFKYQSDWASL